MVFHFVGAVRVGNYVINKRRTNDYLGRGTFGEVYMGKHVTEEKTVAIKRIYDDSDGRFKETEFLKELVKIEHENIVTVLDIIEGDSDGLNVNYIVMELCKYGDLHKCFKDHHEMIGTDIVKLELMCQFLKGVEFLHSNNMVHRDLKPANILVTDRPDTPGEIIAKISDFGSGKVLDPESSTMYSTSAVGTRLFKAPEFLGQVEYTKKVDSFAAGLTCLAMLQPLDDRDKLHPRIEGELIDASAETECSDRADIMRKYDEGHFTIAEVMRKFDINDLGAVNIVQLDGPLNTVLSNNIRKVIKDATAYDPDDRLSVKDMLEWLQDILKISQESRGQQVNPCYNVNQCLKEFEKEKKSIILKINVEVRNLIVWKKIGGPPGLQNSYETGFTYHKIHSARDHVWFSRLWFSSLFL